MPEHFEQKNESTEQVRLQEELRTNRAQVEGLVLLRDNGPEDILGKIGDVQPRIRALLDRQGVLFKELDKFKN